MKRVGVIMAGGGGTRFWPISRLARPKQLISLTSDQLMINETINRVKNIIAMEDLFIITNHTQQDLMYEKVLPDIDRTHILIEPAGRNTAPCILYSTLVIQKLYGDDVVISVLPSDHHITDTVEYEQIMNLAFHAAEQYDEIITVGLWPTQPNTGYGYIRFAEPTDMEKTSGIYRIQRFVEKPEKVLAQEYVRSGRYLWNSGMFLGKSSVILQAFQTYLPDLYQKMTQIYQQLRTNQESDAIQSIYGDLTAVSIDYGILERIQKAHVIPAEFGWNDVGSWDSLSEIFTPDDDNNVIHAQHLGIDTQNCIISSVSPTRLISTLGIKDLIIVDSGDALLICQKDRAQEVKKLVDELKQVDREDLL
ncbi:MAG: mannose-1-phosphate guanylyltransferase [Clostridiaceae bacterium]|nr:mannose-1-phosphate guanylyltransferase [Clostridiaceae bacterium]